MQRKSQTFVQPVTFQHVHVSPYVMCICFVTTEKCSLGKLQQTFGEILADCFLTRLSYSLLVDISLRKPRPSFVYVIRHSFKWFLI